MYLESHFTQPYIFTMSNDFSYVSLRSYTATKSDQHYNSRPQLSVLYLQKFRCIAQKVTEGYRRLGASQFIYMSYHALFSRAVAEGQLFQGCGNSKAKAKQDLAAKVLSLVAINEVTRGNILSCLPLLLVPRSAVGTYDLASVCPSVLSCVPQRSQNPFMGIF